jgi:hypothetical protein
MLAKLSTYKKLTLLVIVFFVPVFLPGNFANAAENEEIDFLLSYIASSGCNFIRNGDEHQATEASKHLKMKYNHAKDRIKSAENFIDKIATKSSFTNRSYEVICHGTRLPTKEWLEEALASYRTSAGD